MTARIALSPDEAPAYVLMDVEHFDAYQRWLRTIGRYVYAAPNVDVNGKSVFVVGVDVPPPPINDDVIGSPAAPTPLSEVLDAAYIRTVTAALGANEAAVRPLMTRICPECGMAAIVGDRHGEVDGYVVISCGGNWLVDEAVVLRALARRTPDEGGAASRDRKRTEDVGTAEGH